MADVKISALTAATAAVGTQEFPVNDSGTSKKVTLTQVRALINPGIINVKAYGATGDGSTDDTSAINSAIAVLNAGTGEGVLYFPQGTYKVTSALTTITGTATICGDGGSGTAADVYANPVTEVQQTSATANLFTIQRSGTTIRDIALTNISGTTPSAGAGVLLGIGSGTDGWKEAYFCRLENVTISKFYDDLVVQDGAGWTVTNCFIYDPVRYGIRIQGLVSPDSGDQSIVGTYFMAENRAGTAAIRYEAAGGLKVVNCKVNYRSTAKFVSGISLAPTGANSGVTLIANSSFENVTGNLIDIRTNTITWRHVTVVGCNFATYSGTGHAIYVNCTNLNELTLMTIVGCTFQGSTTSAIDLTKVDNTVISACVTTGYTSLLTTSGCTNIKDASGGVSAGKLVTAGVTALDGANPTPVATGLTTVTTFVATLQGSAAPGTGTSEVTYTLSGGTANVYAWKPTSSSNPTLVASTGTESFSWVAVGT